MDVEKVTFQISDEDIKLIETKLSVPFKNIQWSRDKSGNITCKRGKLLKLLGNEVYRVRQIIKSDDYRRTNLQWSYIKPYINEGILHVPLSGEKGFGFTAKTAPECMKIVGSVSWTLNQGGYADSKDGLMHRVVMKSIYGEEAIKSKIVDHIDGDRLNNHPVNLRIATSKSNAKNRTSNPVSGYEGVEKLPNGTYCCKVKQITVFEHQDPKVCALCYDSVITYVYGTGKRLNDNLSRAPIGIGYWQLSIDIMQKLDALKIKHTDFHGVKHSRDGWKSKITIDLGCYETAEEAAIAYDMSALMLDAKLPLNFENKTYTVDELSKIFSKLSFLARK
jgi:hypothetical protein